MKESLWDDKIVQVSSEFIKYLQNLPQQEQDYLSSVVRTYKEELRGAVRKSNIDSKFGYTNAARFTVSRRIRHPHVKGSFIPSRWYEVTRQGKQKHMNYIYLNSNIDVDAAREEIMHAILDYQLVDIHNKNSALEDILENNIMSVWEQIQHLEILVDNLFTLAANRLGIYPALQNASYQSLEEDKSYIAGLNPEVSKKYHIPHIFGTLINMRFMTPHISEELVQLRLRLAQEFLSEYGSNTGFTQLVNILSVPWGAGEFAEPNFNKLLDELYLSINQFSARADRKLSIEEIGYIKRLITDLNDSLTAPSGLLDLVLYLIDSRDINEAIDKACIVISHAMKSNSIENIVRAHKLFPQRLMNPELLGLNDEGFYYDEKRPSIGNYDNIPGKYSNKDNYQTDTFQLNMVFRGYANPGFPLVTTLTNLKYLQLLLDNVARGLE